MSRLMSVAMTEQAVIDRIKTVTRRKGWWLDSCGRHLAKPGDTLVLVRKAMGRKTGEALVRLAEVEIIDVRREPLGELLTHYALTQGADYGPAEVTAEGFPGMDPVEFVQRFFIHAQGVTPPQDVTRIEWRYLDTYTRPWTDDVRSPGTTSTTVTVKRSCNGCGRRLGDVTEAELDAAMSGAPLPDVRDECGRHA